MERFQFQQYDSEAVIFDTASGDTHYLPPLALELFRLCHAFPMISPDDVRHFLAERNAIEPGVLLDAHINETLDGLRRIELLSDLNETAATSTR